MSSSVHGVFLPGTLGGGLPSNMVEAAIPCDHSLLAEATTSNVFGNLLSLKVAPVGFDLGTLGERSAHNVGATRLPDCQFATYAMATEPYGLAPIEWLNDVGDCFIFRADGKPLTRQHVSFLWNYLCVMLDEVCVDHELAQDVVRKFKSREYFQLWVRHRKNTITGVALELAEP